MSGALYDAGALIAAERNDRRFWAEHKARLQSGVVPLTTAPVVAQVIRSGRQVTLHRLLKGCAVAEFVVSDGHEVGRTLATSLTSDVVDAHVAIVAAREGRAVITSDSADLRRLRDALGATFLVIEA
jgi:predicted nucleic acid-binding protein